MGRFRSKRLSTKIIISVVLSVVVSISLVAIILYFLLFSLIKERVIQDLRVHAEIVGSNCSAALLFEDRMTASEILSSFRAIKSIENAVLYDTQGREFAFYLKKGSTYIPFLSEDLDSDDFIVVRQNIVVKGESVGILYVRSNLSQLNLQVRTTFVMILLSILISSGICLVMVYFFVSKIFRPVKILLTTMRDVSEKDDFSLRAEIVSDDEFGELTENFNNMLNQIKSRDDKIREYQGYLESEVEKRTRELNEANIRLKEEIAAIQRMEEILARSANEWRTTFDSIKDAIFLIDENGNIHRCNLSACELIGLSFDKIRGNNICDIAHRRIECNCKLHEAVEKRSRMVTDIKIDDRTFLVVYDPVLVGERLTGFVHTMSDITDQIKLDENLKQIQKMEAMGRLAGGVAHDFNNLLSVMTLYVGSLLKRVKEDPRVLNELTELKKAIERASDLSRQLLLFSRKQLMNPSSFDVNDVLRSNLKMLSRLIGENIKIELSLTDKKVLIFADIPQFENAIMNIVINAKDAMPGGGTIRIVTEKKRLGKGDINLPEFFDKECLILRVIDNGYGMSEEVQKKIFEPFFTTKPKGKGTGLGLAMVYGFVKQCNGHIEVISSPKKGTEFRIFLPTTEMKEEGRRVSGDIKPVSPEKINILLVEDDVDVRRSIVKMLTEERFPVVEAASALEALDILVNDKKRIDLILTDIVMPEMDGIAFSKKVREIKGEIPILFMTGYSDDYLPEEDIREYRDIILQKPFTESQLLNKIREAIL